ncbi:unnamed protein product, partial [Prorocentrum cordatum]
MAAPAIGAFQSANVHAAGVVGQNFVVNGAGDVECLGANAGSVENGVCNRARSLAPKQCVAPGVKLNLVRSEPPPRHHNPRAKANAAPSVPKGKGGGERKLIMTQCRAELWRGAALDQVQDVDGWFRFAAVEALAGVVSMVAGFQGGSLMLMTALGLRLRGVLWEVALRDSLTAMLIASLGRSVRARVPVADAMIGGFVDAGAAQHIFRVASAIWNWEVVAVSPASGAQAFPLGAGNRAELAAALELDRARAAALFAWALVQPKEFWHFDGLSCPARGDVQKAAAYSAAVARAEAVMGGRGRRARRRAMEKDSPDFRAFIALLSVPLGCALTAGEAHACDPG